MFICTVTLPDGTTATRRSLNRKYAFAIVGERLTFEKRAAPETWAWCAFSWHLTRSGADKALAHRGRSRWARNLSILPATVETHAVQPLEDKALAKRRAGRFGKMAAESIVQMRARHVLEPGVRAWSEDSAVGYAREAAHNGLAFLGRE